MAAHKRGTKNLLKHISHPFTFFVLGGRGRGRMQKAKNLKVTQLSGF